MTNHHLARTALWAVRRALLLGTVAGVMSGAARADGGKWLVFRQGDSGLPNDMVTALAVDSLGGVWCTPLRHGIARVSVGTWETIAPPGGTRDAYAPGLAVAPGNTIWVGFGGATGLSACRPGSIRTYTTSECKLASDDVISIACDRAGDVYVATNYGLSVLDTTGAWHTLDEHAGFPDRIVSVVGTAPEGTAWIGFGRRNGVAVVRHAGVQCISDEGTHFPANHALAIAVEAGGDSAWVGTDGGGLAHCVGADVRVYSTANSGLPDNTVNALALDARGTLWCGTEGGLARFDGKEWTTYTMLTSQLPNDHVLALAIDRQGHVWIGTQDGLAEFVPE